MDVRFGLWRKLSTEELMLLNCGVGEDSWESLGLQGDPPVHSKGDQSWVFIGRTNVEAETPILGPLMRRADSFEKTLILGRIEGRRRREWQRMRWFNGATDSMDMGLGGLREFGDGQRGLVCCRSWGCKESHSATKLNWTYWGWPCAPNSLVVGLQLAFHSHGTTSLLLIAYTKYLLSFGVHLSLNWLRVFLNKVSPSGENCGGLHYHGTTFFLGKTCIHLFWNKQAQWSSLLRMTLLL